jgi:hypothetical protein
MATQQPKTIPKISVQIWRPVLDRLNAKMEEACLRRDAYLNKVVRHELDHLDAEIAIPNTEVVRQYIANRLDTLDRKLVSLALEPELVERLNDICRRKRLVRDSFFNRLLLLLAAQSKTIDRLYFPVAENWRKEVWEAYRHDDALYRELFTPLEPHTDPLWALRVGLELMNEEIKSEAWTHPETGQSVQIVHSINGEPRPLDGVYTQTFEATTFKNVDLTGLNVYLPESYVPGSAAAEAERKTLDDILVLL